MTALSSNPIADAGPWFKPAEVAPMVGRTAVAVRQLCADNQIDHQEIRSPGGRVRYLISQQAVNRFVRLRTVSAA